MAYVPHEDPLLLSLAVKAGRRAEALTGSRDPAIGMIQNDMQDMLDRIGSQIDAKAERNPK